MGLRGPKPKSVRSKPLPAHPIGDTPQWLHEYAQAEWRRVSDLNPTLAAVQASLFAAYCQSFARWRLAEEAQSGGLMGVSYNYLEKAAAAKDAETNKQAMFRAARALELDQGEVDAPGDPLAEHRMHAEGLRKPAGAVN